MSGGQLANSMIMRSFEVGGFCAMISGEKSQRREAVDQLSRLQQPLVLFQEAIALPGADICIVRQDDYGGGRLIADHLLARRVSNYLVIVPRQHWPAIEYRLDGLRDGLASDGGVTMNIVTSASEAFDDVQTALGIYLQTHAVPGAVVGGNDSIATAALLHLIDAGYRVPEDIRVVGFNGFEAHRYSRPRLTTVRSQPYELGICAGRAILNRLETGSFDQHEYVLPVHFQPNLTT
jgi:DNA-binding LacI/PurR family transcriptional regulator